MPGRDALSVHLDFRVVSCYERRHKSDFHGVIACRDLKVIANNPFSIGIKLGPIAQGDDIRSDIAQSIFPIRIASVKIYSVVGVLAERIALTLGANTLQDIMFTAV